MKIIKKRIIILVIGLAIILLSFSTLSYLSKLRIDKLTSLGKGTSPRFLDNNRILMFSDSGLEIGNLSGIRTEIIGELEDRLGDYQWLHSDKILYQIRVDPPKGFENGFQFWLFDVPIQEASPLSTKVFSGAPTSNLALSPSRTKIAFPMPIKDIGSVNKKMLIHIMDLETMETLVVDTPNETYCREPDWSPDETKIIYTCRTSGISIRNPISEHVWLTDLSTNESELLMEKLTDYRFFSWSPNNEWVAFTHNFSVWLAPVKNGIPDLKAKYHLRFRDEINIYMWDPDFYFSPPGKVSWSPNSKYITVAGSLYGRDEHEVWIAELE